MIAVVWFAADRRFSRIDAVDYGIAITLVAIVGSLTVAYTRLRHVDRTSSR
jgi:hypothetical protein